MKLLILEGSDLSGKTTLANQFLLTKNVFMAHVDKPTIKSGNALEYWKTFVQNHPWHDLGNDTVFMWDRSPIGNYIYGNLKGDQVALSRDELFELIAWLKRTFTEVHIFILRCSNYERAKRFKERGEKYVTLEEANHIQDLYMRLSYSLRKRFPKSIHILSTNASIEKNAAAVKKFL